MKKYHLLLTTCIIVIAFFVSGCPAKAKQDNRIVIYSSCDQVRNTALLETLNAKFPDYIIDLLYLPTGTNGARLKSEGKNTEADIILGLEVSYLQQVRGILADLSSYDKSEYMLDILDTQNQYLPWERFSCVIAINENLLKEKKLPIPHSYEDLLKPQYKDLISMPNPNSSSTGHLFLAYFIDRMGEDAAYAYFDELAKNVTNFPSSGSGVSTALINGDIAIGFTMTFNAVNEIDRGANLTLTYFGEESPSSLGGVAMTLKGEKNAVVNEVFQYIITDLSKIDKSLYSPEQIYNDQAITREHYPQVIPYKLYIISPEYKEHMLSRWKY